MAKTLCVYLDGVLAGEVTQSAQGALAFTYDETYRMSVDATPVSLSIPLSERSVGNRATLRFLQGLLPDSEAVLQAWSREYGVSADSPFALLAHVGQDVAGALQLASPEVAPGDMRERAGRITALSDDDLATLVNQLALLTRIWGGEHAGRWSLAGSQSKIALHHDPDTGQWGIPLDATPTTHILKPDIPGYEHHVLNEFLCQQAAGFLGLPAAVTSILRVGEAPPVLVSQRFDRLRHGGVWRRIHQEDMCQALGMNPRRKYQSEGGPGVAEIAALLRSASLPDDRDANVRNFFRALAFNVLIDGTDAHARNYAVVLSGPRVVLAPLYDAASYAPYEQRAGSDTRPTTVPLNIGGERTTRLITLRHWRKVAAVLEIPTGEAEAILRDLQRRLPDAVARAAALPETANYAPATVQRVADAIADTTTRKALH